MVRSLSLHLTDYEPYQLRHLNRKYHVRIRKVRSTTPAIGMMTVTIE